MSGKSNKVVRVLIMVDGQIMGESQNLCSFITHGGDAQRTNKLKLEAMKLVQDARINAKKLNGLLGVEQKD